MRFRIIPWLIPAAFAAGCGYKDTATIPPPVERPAETERPGALTDADRFGLRMPGPAMGQTQAPAPGATAPAGFEFDTPPNWRQVDSSQFRDPNFIIGDNPEAQAYVTVLAGEGGGIEANLNRWRVQMSLPNLAPAEIADLPHIELLGMQAPLLDVTGSYSAGRMGGAGGGIAEARMLGTAVIREGHAIFIKMIGPAAALDNERESLIAFARSLRPAKAPADATHARMGTMPNDDVHAGVAAAPAAGGIEMGQAPADLRWEAPAGWTKAPDQSMRVVTYTAGEGGSVECYLSVLGAGGGGEAANIDRWRGQMGLKPLEPGELERMETIEVHGRQVRLADFEGTFTGMGTQKSEDYGLLGVVCELPERTIFVKLTGPAEAVRGERDAFIEFCKSLKQGQ